MGEDEENYYDEDQEEEDEDYGDDYDENGGWNYAEDDAEGGGCNYGDSENGNWYSELGERGFEHTCDTTGSNHEPSKHNRTNKRKHKMHRDKRAPDSSSYPNYHPAFRDFYPPAPPPSFFPSPFGWPFIGMPTYNPFGMYHPGYTHSQHDFPHSPSPLDPYYMYKMHKKCARYFKTLHD